ncbi:MAG: radical SAM protein [Thermodesulfobacteriota bacterium]
MDSAQFETERSLIDRGIITGRSSRTDRWGMFVPKYLMLQWHVTDACNLRCSHCYQDSFSAEHEMPFEGMTQVIEQYLRVLSEWGIRGHINFTGGEPFLHGRFLELLERVHAHREQIGFAVLTNGTVLTKDIAKSLKRLGCRFVQVSLEGGQAVHDGIRGPGSFEKTLAGLKLLRKAGLTTMVSFTLQRRNVADFPELVHLCERNRVDVLWSDRALPLGNARELRGHLMMPSEIRDFFDLMCWHKARLNRKWFNKTEIRIHRALQFLSLRARGAKHVRPYRCSAGRSLLTIMPSGLVTPCRRMPVSVGDINRKYLGDIYRESVLLADLRDFEHCPSGCEACEFRDTCNGGLRCLSYAYFGDPFRADPQCFHRSTTLLTAAPPQTRGDLPWI